MNVRKWIIVFFDPNESVTLFLIGTSALTIFLAILYDSIKEKFGLFGAWGFALILLLIVIGVIASQYILRRKRPKSVVVAENTPRQKKGLILLLSPYIGSSIPAIEYHLPKVQALWLVSTPKSAGIATKLNEQYKDKVKIIHWGENYEVDADEPKSTFDIVKSILLSAPREYIFVPQIIADITGGTKPMSVGMTLACLAYGVDIQYMKAPRDALGRVDQDAQPLPIQIDINVSAQGGPNIPLTSSRD